jgi:SNF2 family DNA or RNA helicase
MADTMAFSYQDEAVEWMDLREQDRLTPGGFLCHEMGLGKTHMMCRHISNQLDRAPRTLLLTTKSTVKSWKDTLCSYSNFRFDVREGIECPLTAGRPTVIVATHHSILKKDVSIPAVQRIVVDEAHVMRNQKKMFTKMVELSTGCRYRWGLTATPFNNHDSDMRAYVKFLRPTEENTNPRLFQHFFLRKVREDVVTGGPKLHIRKVAYDFEFDEERRLYEYVSGRIDEGHAWIAANARLIPWRQRGNMIMTLMLRQRQAAIHPQLVLNAEKVWAAQMPGGPDVADWDPTRVSKVKRIMDLVKTDQGRRRSTMVITHFKEEMKMLKERFEAEGIPVGCIDGKTKIDTRRAFETRGSTYTPEERYSALPVVDEWTTALGMKPLPEDTHSVIRSFLDPPPMVLLLQIQAGGVGLSLPWVHHVINASPDWNPFLEQQAMYRAYRINTKHDVHVTSLHFRETIEVHIHAKQVGKLERGAEWLGDNPDRIRPFTALEGVAE